MSVNEIILLLVSGVIVGIINTLGGGGSVITMALFMAMGIPVAVANGTNRIAVVKYLEFFQLIHSNYS